MPTKRKKKSVRKQAQMIPAWCFDRDVPVALKREVEDGLARHAADNGMSVTRKQFQELTLPDICASLKVVHARWGELEPGMIDAST